MATYAYRSNKRPNAGDEPTPAVDRTSRVRKYRRRSTNEENQPYSIEAQDARLDPFIKSQPGWELDGQYGDDASGATIDREGLQQALRDAKAGLYDVLLVYRLDRLTRSIRDLLVIVDILDEAGVALVSATEHFDSHTPLGRMVMRILAIFAEFERDMIIDRVIAGMERKAARGGWTSGSHPLRLLPRDRPGRRQDWLPGPQRARRAGADHLRPVRPPKSRGPRDRALAQPARSPHPQAQALEPQSHPPGTQEPRLHRRDLVPRHLAPSTPPPPGPPGPLRHRPRPARRAWRRPRRQSRQPLRLRPGQPGHPRQMRQALHRQRRQRQKRPLPGRFRARHHARRPLPPPPRGAPRRPGSAPRPPAATPGPVDQQHHPRSRPGGPGSAATPHPRRFTRDDGPTRKALLKTLIAEVKVEDRGHIRPLFYVSTLTSNNKPQVAVRDLGPQVVLSCHNTNTAPLVEGLVTRLTQQQ